MILEPECVACIFQQILKAIRTLNPELPNEKIIKTQRRLMKYLVESDVLDNPSPLIAQKVYSLVAETLETDDPYKHIKLESNKLALTYVDQVKKIINSSEDPIFEAIAISALGNTIDYGANHKVDLINDIENFTVDNLVINDIPDFKKAMEKSEKLLILGDNAGEIVFDKILVETLKEHYPELEITFSVRAGPIINDATMEDARFIGLTDMIKVIESPAAPGVALSTASDEFKSYFCAEDNGIILSKGQGNFESLYKKEVKNKQVYYLLKAKCPLMERLFHVGLGDLIFKKKTKDL